MEDGIIPVEIVVRKDKAAVFMSVPYGCGLKEADTLRIEKRSMLAMKGGSVLPVDLPVLTDTSYAGLVEWWKQGRDLPVSEFMARGMGDSYFLKLVVV